jgi:Flp pilus assembly protein TadG
MAMIGLGKWTPLRGEAGQALIEAAIAAPLFFVLLLGAAELARVSYEGIEVANAARAGVQYASQNEKSLADSTGITLAAQNDGYDANKVSGITASVSEAYMCADGTTSYTTSSTNLPSCNSGATAIPTVTVTTSANFDPLIHIPGLPSTFTLSSSATETCVDCQ